MYSAKNGIGHKDHLKHCIQSFQIHQDEAHY